MIYTNKLIKRLWIRFGVNDPKLDTFTFYIISTKIDVALCTPTWNNVFKIGWDIYVWANLYQTSSYGLLFDVEIGWTFIFQFMDFLKLFEGFTMNICYFGDKKIILICMINLINRKF